MKRLVFLLLCIEGAVLSFNVAATSALIPSIASTFGLPEFYIGKIIWLYMLPYGLAALFYGPLTRTFNAKHIELICLSLFSLSNIVAAISQSAGMLFISRFCMGLFGASVIPLALILISHNVNSQERGKYVGLFFGSTFISSLIGLFLSGFIDWRIIYLAPGIAGIILCVFMAIYFPSFKEKKENFRMHYFSILSRKSIFNLFFYIFCISMFYHAIQQWLAVYFSVNYDLNQFAISILLTLGSISAIFGEVVGGLLSDKLGRVKTSNIGIILLIVTVLSLLYPRYGVISLSLIMVIWGLGWTFNHSSISTMLTDLPKELLYEASSLNSSVRFIAGGLGAALAGFIMQRSFRLSFMVFGFCMILLLYFSKGLLIKKQGGIK